MKCSVIALSNDNAKKHFWSRRKIQKKWLSYTGYSGGCDVYILPYKNTEIFNMGEKKLLKILNKLSEDITNSMIFTCDNRKLKDILLLFGAAETDGSDVFLDISDILIRKCTKNNGWAQEELEIGIYDYEFTNKSIYLANHLSRSYGHISLFTKNVDIASSYMLEVYEESGMPIRVSDDFENYLKTMKIIIALGRIKEGEIAEDAVVLDVFDENTDGSFHRISQIKFSLPDAFEDLPALTGRKADQKMIDFIISTGAQLILGEDIQIIGYS
ncbi:MAG: hypothetical protein N2171_06790 [Clostridia bacterium]|nr:hypothetical protein [Clostridia bacterium]